MAPVQYDPATLALAHRLYDFTPDAEGILHGDRYLIVRTTDWFPGKQEVMAIFPSLAQLEVNYDWSNGPPEQIIDLTLPPDQARKDIKLGITGFTDPKPVVDPAPSLPPGDGPICPDCDTLTHMHPDGIGHTCLNCGSSRGVA